MSGLLFILEIRSGNGTITVLIFVCYKKETIMETGITLQQISDLLDRKLEEKLEQKFDEAFGERLNLILDKKFDEAFGERLNLILDKKFDEKLAPIHKQLKSHTRRLKTLEKNRDTMLLVLDREQSRQAKRLDRVEDHLGLLPLSQY